MKKKLLKWIIILLVIAILVAGAILIWKKHKNSNAPKEQPQVYEVLVQLRDNADLKKGDVLLVLPEGHKWSKTEEASYLILKMRMKPSEAQELVEPETKSISEKEAEEKGIVSDEQLKSMNGSEKKKALVETTVARRYRIKIETLDFDPAKVRDAQPFPDKVFDWSIVEDKTASGK